MTWTEDRIAEFADMVAEWPVSITVGSVTKVGLKTPSIRTKPIQGQQGPYAQDRSSTFDLLRTDFVALGLGDRKQFTCEGVTWEINKIMDDPSEPVIQFRAEDRR